MRTGGSCAPERGPSTKAARKSNNCGHFRGFLALTTLPSVLSRRAYTRSPSSPWSLSSEAFSSSPIIDLIGYRQRDTTDPRTVCAECDILRLLLEKKRGEPTSIDRTLHVQSA